MPKMANLVTFWKSENSCQTVLPDNFKRTKMGGKCQTSKIEIRYFGDFQTEWKVQMYKMRQF